MRLEYNYVDLSDYPTKYGFSETPRRVAGPNEGVAINGRGIDDTVAIKMDPTFTLKPLAPEQVAVLWELALMPGYRTLVYEDSTGTVVETEARMIFKAGAALAMVNSEHIFYNGLSISFEIR